MIIIKIHCEFGARVQDVPCPVGARVVDVHCQVGARVVDMLSEVGARVRDMHHEVWEFAKSLRCFSSCCCTGNFVTNSWIPFIFYSKLSVKVSLTVNPRWSGCRHETVLFCVCVCTSFKFDFKVTRRVLHSAPPPVSVLPQAFCLAAFWHCVDWWSTKLHSHLSLNPAVRWTQYASSHCGWYFSSSVNVQLYVFRRLGLPPQALFLPVSCRLAVNRPVTLIAWLLLPVPGFSLWGRHAGHSLGFSHAVLLVVFWLVEAWKVSGSSEPSVGSHWAQMCEEQTKLKAYGPGPRLLKSAWVQLSSTYRSCQ